MDICRHDDLCGGCAYQGVPYDEQLSIKEKEVLGYMKENLISAGQTEHIDGCERICGYRNKMEYTFGDLEKGGEMTLGMHKKGHFMSVVTVDGCMLVPADFNIILSAVLEFCKTKGYAKYHKRSHSGLMRNLIVRRGENTHELLINIVTTSLPGFDDDAFVSMICSLTLENTVVGILHTVNDDVADTIKCQDMRILRGRDWYMEKIMGLDFKVSAFSFFQTNVPAAERLYREAIALLDDTAGKVIFDLFCGTGTITQALAAGAKKVVGVEIVEDAVAAARSNAALNGLDNCEFICGDVYKILKQINEGTIEGIPDPDVIVVDPPRIGVTPKAMEKILAYGVKQLLYISCNPKTLFKDLAAAVQRGYAVRYLKPFDNFPMTKHVECVCLLGMQHR